MTSDVGICNAALVKIGAKTIMALDDTSKESRLCSARFADVRDEVLRDHPWNFALRRATLPQLTATPPFGYDYQYQLPNECLRVVSVNDDARDYAIEGRALLTNASAVELIYVARMTDASIFDSMFVNALSLRLASELAFSLTNSRELVNSLLDQYRDTVRRARAIDAQENAPTPLYSDQFVDARR